MMPRPLLYLVAVAFGLVGSCWGGYYAGRQECQVPAAIQPLHDETIRAESIAARVDTVVQTKTKTLTKTITDYQTVRQVDTVTLTERIRDTVWVKQVVERCDALVLTCDQFKASALEKFRADSNVLRAQAREIRAYRVARPSTLDKAITALKWVAVGYVAREVQR